MDSVKITGNHVAIPVLSFRVPTLIVNAVSDPVGRVRTTVVPLQPLEASSGAITRSVTGMATTGSDNPKTVVSENNWSTDHVPGCVAADATGVASADVVLPQLPGVTLDKGPSVFVNPFSTFKYKDKWHFVDHVGEVHRPDLMAQLLGTETWPPPDSDDAE